MLFRSRIVPYRTSGGMLKPLMDVALVGPNGKQLPKLRALVDSGCDFSTFPSALARPLGIDTAADCFAMEIHTASGLDRSQVCYPHGIHGLIFGQKLALSANFHPMLPIALLGREDFMAHFRVTFDERRKLFILEAH